jgi:hypothetical protein
MEKYGWQLAAGSRFNQALGTLTISNFGWRIAKPGTRSKGGSPKENFGLRI